METQNRLINFIRRSNWVLFAVTSVAGFIFAPVNFALGILCGGLIVTLNFHMLSRTLKRALTPPNLASHNVVLAKYYIRFIISGIIIFVLIAGRVVNPLGLILGLSVVVASIMLATLFEVKHLICKEAV